MSATYRIFLIDEFNWDYRNFRRDQIVKQVKKVAPHAILEADIYQMMIFDVDKTHPSEFIGKVLCDKILMQDSDIANKILPADLPLDTN